MVNMVFMWVWFVIGACEVQKTLKLLDQDYPGYLELQKSAKFCVEIYKKLQKLADYSKRAFSYSWGWSSDCQ